MRVPPPLGLMRVGWAPPEQGRGAKVLCRLGRAHRPPATSARLRRLAYILAPLLAASPFAWAETDCKGSFEQWVKLSEARLRFEEPVMASRIGERSACVPSESVRRELLDGLARSRSQCAEATSWLDQGPQQTKILLDINEGFVNSLAVCRAQPVEAAPTWATKAVPAAKPPPPPTPPPSPPAAAVLAPSLPAAAVPCLNVLPARQGRYVLSNERCRGRTILAVIETRAAGGKTQCRGLSVGQSLTVESSEQVPPRINHECILNQARCSKSHLEMMFPECDW